MAYDITESAQVANRITIDNWKGWDNPVNEKSAVKGLLFLEHLCATYQELLTKLNKEYEIKRDILRKQNTANLNSGRRGEDAAIEELKKQYDQDIKELDALKRGAEACNSDLQRYLSNTTKTSKGLKRFMEGVVSVTVASEENARRSAEEQMKAAYEQFLSAVETQKARRKLLLEKQIHEVQAKAQSGSSEESLRYSETLERLQNEWKNKVAELHESIKEAFEAVMAENIVSGYSKTISSSVMPYENYTCSTSVPDIVYFGNVSKVIGEKQNLLPEVHQFFSFGRANIMDSRTLGALTAKLPYCQTLEDGISLFLSCSSPERRMYYEHLKALLLRLFMSFPPGKLEATMIDPVELGGTFAMFTKLGEENNRIIDTKIWSQEKDITEVIGILRQKIETITQTYGDDKATRLKKEPVRVLAITDFPNGFTREALRDLQAIVRKSASAGICVFIWASNEEMEKLMTSQQAVFNEIKQMLHVAAVSGNELLLESEGCSGVKLSLDKSDMDNGDADAVIATLAKGISDESPSTEWFEDMYNDIEDKENWFGCTSSSELSIPIGFKGANTVVKLTVGKGGTSTAHHALIAGETGSGKSNLFHTIIMSTLLNYSPAEVQMYLVDFKDGVEFKSYSKFDLPSIKVVVIDCEREFALSILEDLSKEMDRRYDKFHREAGVAEISKYRETFPLKTLPRLLVVFDEVQELFRGDSNDEISIKCKEHLEKLLALGRAAGIHILLASQSFDFSAKQFLFTNAAIRIAIGSNDGASSVLSGDNPGAKQLEKGKHGVAIYNDDDGKEAKNVVFQIAFMDPEKRNGYLSQLNGLLNSEESRKKYKTHTKVLLTNAEDDIFNVFNQLIIDKKVAVLDEDKTRYCLTVGDSFDINRRLKIGIPPEKGQNLLVIGSDEKRAAGLFYFSILSLLYGELGNDDVRKDNQLIHLVDLSDEDVYSEPDKTSFKHLAELFPKQVKREQIRGMEDLISNTYATLLRRMDGTEAPDERLFLMFFGIDRARRLKEKTGAYHDDEYAGEKTARAKLGDIIEHGAQYGINCIFWGESLSASAEIIGANISSRRWFAKRIVFDSDDETMEQLVEERHGSTLRRNTAVYYDIDNDVRNTHFRIYEIPTKVWVNKIAKVYREFEQTEF